MPRGKHSDRRSSHRTRFFFDGITSAEIALVILLESLARTLPDTARVFVDSMGDLLSRDVPLTPGIRANLEKMRRVIAANNRNNGIH